MSKKLQFNPRNNIEQLLIDNFGLIVKQALFFKPNNNYVLEEYIQIGILAFLKVANSFDPNKGKFSTYISNCVHNAIFDFIKKNKKVQIINIKEDIIENSVSNNIMELIPDSLSDKETKFITLKLDNYSKKEIMELLDITIKEYNYMFKNIKKKIKEANEN